MIYETSTAKHGDCKGKQTSDENRETPQGKHILNRGVENPFSIAFHIT